MVSFTDGTSTRKAEKKELKAKRKKNLLNAV